jgi:hypothetical protein
MFLSSWINWMLSKSFLLWALSSLMEIKTANCDDDYV